MSLYSIYFTQVLLPLLDLRYSQSHSNITIATENAFVLFFFFVIFQNSFVIFVHFRVLQIMSKFFVFAFKSLQLHILKKSFVMCLYLTNISFLRYFFNSFSQESLISLQHLSYNTVQYKHDMTEL